MGFGKFERLMELNFLPQGADIFSLLPRERAGAWTVRFRGMRLFRICQLSFGKFRSISLCEEIVRVIISKDCVSG